MLVKRSIRIAGHATSIGLEPEFWAELDAICAARNISLPELVVEIDAGRADRPLASSLRVFALSAVKSDGRSDDLQPKAGS